MGVTIGAGIYVLIGAAAGRAGMQALLAFVAAAVLMGLTAASFAELATCMPVAAGEAHQGARGRNPAPRLSRAALAPWAGLISCLALLLVDLGVMIAAR